MVRHNISGTATACCRTWPHCVCKKVSAAAGEVRRIEATRGLHAQKSFESVKVGRSALTDTGIIGALDRISYN